jgi:hypothetical protein
MVESAGMVDGAEAAVEPAAAPGPGDDPWSVVIHTVRKTKRGLAAILANAQVVGEEGGYLILRLAASDPFQRAAITGSDGRPAIQAAIQEAYGRPLGWKLEVVGVGTGGAQANGAGAAATPAGGPGKSGDPGTEGDPGMTDDPGTTPADPAQAGEPKSRRHAGRPASANGGRSNLADIERIADRLNGDIIGPS